LIHLARSYRISGPAVSTWVPGDIKSREQQIQIHCYRNVTVATSQQAPQCHPGRRRAQSTIATNSVRLSESVEQWRQTTNQTRRDVERIEQSTWSSAYTHGETFHYSALLHIAVADNSNVTTLVFCRR